MERRDMIKLMAVLPLGTWALAACDVESAGRKAASSVTGGATDGFTPEFFNALEWRTVRVLVDIVIPRDDRSGSATDAGVPEFMDFILTEYPGNRARMRNGLAWLNGESRSRYGVPFPDLTDEQRTAIVENIAWPRRAKPEHAAGVQFFNGFRDLTATGFWSSRMGVQDLEYRGNVPQTTWTGCPDEVLRHIGVSA